MHYVYKKTYSSGKFYHGYHEGTELRESTTDYVRNQPSVFTDGYTGSGTGRRGQILHEDNNPGDIVTMTIVARYYIEDVARAHERRLIDQNRGNPDSLNRT